MPSYDVLELSDVFFVLGLKNVPSISHTKDLDYVGDFDAKKVIIRY
jgi:hypothetical protein